MYRRFLVGDFGNIYPHYASIPDAVRACGDKHPSEWVWNVRDLQPMGTFWRDRQWTEVVSGILAGLWPKGYMLTPTIKGIEAYRTVNAECYRNETDGLYLYYSTAPGYMRESLAAGGKGVGGTTALLTLRHYLNDNSYDDLTELLDRYPDHQIEFSAYSKCFGTMKGRNAVIWEVRYGY